MGRLTVEERQAEVGRLVVERQAIRSNGSSPSALEANRLAIVRAQADLGEALIERHLRVGNG